MTSVIYFLILFFFLLILCQIFLAHIENIVEGMENNTSSTTTSSSSSSSTSTLTSGQIQQLQATSRIFSELASNPSLANNSAFAPTIVAASKGPQTTSSETKCMSLLSEIIKTPNSASSLTSQLQNCATVYSNLIPKVKLSPVTNSSSGSGSGNITKAITTTKNVVSPTTSTTTINASAINSDNIAYIPYTSTSEAVPSLVGQNTNNILYLKEKMDNLYQQVQDISGNITNIDNKANLSASQSTHVNSIITQAQSAMPKTPPKVTGTSQTPKTISDLTGYASGN